MMTRNILCAAALVVAGALASPDANASTYMQCDVHRSGVVVASCFVVLGVLDELNTTAYFNASLTCNDVENAIWRFNTDGIVGIAHTFLASQVRHILNTGEDTICTIQAELKIHAIFAYVTVASGDAYGTFRDHYGQ